MSNTIDIGAIITNAQQAVHPFELDDGAIYAIRDTDGGIVLLETPGYTKAAEVDRFTAAPLRIQRKVTLRDADSLIDYLATNTVSPEGGVGEDHRHGVGELEIWADLDNRRIHAILDGGNGHRLHTATLELRHSREWNEWSQVDGKLVPQVQFAQFIEDHLSTIAAPDGGVLLDIVQTLTAKTKVDFKSSTLLANGQRQFEFAETLEAKAGQKGTLAIPTELTLALRPFQGSEPVAMQARFRYRLDDGQLYLGVRLNEPDKALEDAFGRIVDHIQEAAPVRINHGIG